MADTAAVREALASKYASLCADVSLHTADPAGTGAGEVTGGAPAYARRPITWNPVVDGIYVSDPMTFDVPANTDITHVGLWDGGTYRDKRDFAVSFVSQSTFTFTITYTQN